MKMLKPSISCLLILILSYGVSNAQEIILYAAAPEICNGSADTPSTLYAVNPLNAELNAIGPIGFNRVTGLVVLGDGRMVGTANADVGDVRTAILIEVDRSSGQGSLIGIIGDENTPGQCGRVPDITYDPATDTLYGIGTRCDVGNSNGHLLSLNKTTGQATIIGDTGFRGGGNGLAIRDDGTLFLSNLFAPTARLYTVNPVNGMATPIATYNDNPPSFNSFAFHPDTQELYATNNLPPPPLEFRDTVLEIVNTENGQFTKIGNLPGCTDALIFANIARLIPTLSEWGLIAMAGILGIVGFMVMRRRKVTV
jgi:IPTL-CTERM motif